MQTTAFEYRSLLQGPSAAHVWCIRLDRAADLFSRYAVTLSGDEQKRTADYRFDRDRYTFAATRASLRLLLARYTNLSPQSIHFSYDSNRKPSLASQSDSIQVEFNVSHAGGLALIVISTRRVGVDIERINPAYPFLDVAKMIFTELEMETLTALPAQERRYAFYSGWTRKEAYVKGLGYGLSMPLDSFDVRLESVEPPLLLNVRHSGSIKNEWSVWNIDAPDGYVAALAVDLPMCQIAAFELNLSQTEWEF